MTLASNTHTLVLSLGDLISGTALCRSDAVRVKVTRVLHLLAHGPWSSFEQACHRFRRRPRLSVLGTKRVALVSFSDASLVGRAVICSEVNARLFVYSRCFGFEQSSCCELCFFLLLRSLLGLFRLVLPLFFLVRSVLRCTFRIGFSFSLCYLVSLGICCSSRRGRCAGIHHFRIPIHRSSRGIRRRSGTFNVLCHLCGHAVCLLNVLVATS
mmetsp:Transcript_2591/g.4301  ORF Transcript_2591/g.4301 Transcript_2591/m.4301 type:complete len:212 (-) Transcript_2591:33-668(-)